MASVIRGDDNFDSGVNGRLVQSVYHSWTNQTTNSTSTLVVATGSLVTFVPKYVNSNILVTLDISIFHTSSSGSYSGGSIGVFKDSTSIQQVVGVTEGLLDFYYANLSTNNSHYTRVFKQYDLGIHTLVSLDIYTGFNTYIPGVNTTLINASGQTSSMLIQEIL